MIAVIADDLTGAAELGGLALRYGLVAEITTEVNPLSKADILIVATDTRSLSREEARSATEKISRDMKFMSPSVIFKKIDSVLRGHVLPEVYAQQRVMELTKALIVPGNPGLGRTVVDGQYLMNEQPVHLSSFSEDPEFPVRSSAVHDMLNAGEHDIRVIKHYEKMPETGVMIGEVKYPSDLSAWCAKIDKKTLIAGAAEFFTALLEHRGLRPSPRIGDTATLQLPALMICGSSFQKSSEFVSRMKRLGLHVSYVPESLLSGSDSASDTYQNWIDETVTNLKRSGKAIIAVNPSVKYNVVDAPALRELMADATASIASLVNINECLIEGGSTAAAVMRKLDIKTLNPLQELAPGVIRMSVKERNNLHITLKPGSYEWPAAILHPERVKGTYEIDCSVY